MYALQQLRSSPAVDDGIVEPRNSASLESQARDLDERVLRLLSLQEASFRLLRQYRSLEPLTSDAIAESFYIRGLLERLRATPVDDFDRPQIVRELSDTVEVHITRLERSVFPVALELMDRPDAEELSRLLGPRDVYRTQTNSGAA